MGNGGSQKQGNLLDVRHPEADGWILQTGAQSSTTRWLDNQVLPLLKSPFRRSVSNLVQVHPAAGLVNSMRFI